MGDVPSNNGAQLPDLRPCEHQAGGHFPSNKGAATFIDSSGKFYKLFQDDTRGGREASVYEYIFGEGYDELRKEDIVQLRQFVPKYFGTIVTGEKKLLALEDTCSGYSKPCVLDAKIGLTVIYEWADDKYKAKNTMKDLETTQSKLGFRVTGFKVWQQDAGEYFVANRDYGKKLTPETMSAALAKFGSNGVVGPQDVYGGPSGAVAKIRELQSWFESQRSLQFFAASIIIIWEGAAARPEDINVVVRLIDFAHTFPSQGQRDDNVLSGVQILADHLERVGRGEAC